MPMLLPARSCVSMMYSSNSKDTLHTDWETTGVCLTRKEWLYWQHIQQSLWKKPSGRTRKDISARKVPFSGSSAFSSRAMLGMKKSFSWTPKVLEELLFIPECDPTDTYQSLSSRAARIRSIRKAVCEVLQRYSRRSLDASPCMYSLFASL